MSEKSMFDDMSEAELKEFYAKVAINAEKIKKYTEEQIAKAPKSTGVATIPIHINASDFVE